mgnify:CR=1 FL=1
MPFYTYECKKCGEWEHYKPTPFKKIPSQKLCPICDKKSPKKLTVGGFVIKGKTNYKWDKSDVTRMYNEIITDTKERINTTKSPYSKYYMDPKRAFAEGRAKKLSDKEASKKAENERKLRNDSNERMKRRRSK